MTLVVIWVVRPSGEGATRMRGQSVKRRQQHPAGEEQWTLTVHDARSSSCLRANLAVGSDVLGAARVLAVATARAT